MKTVTMPSLWISSSPSAVRPAIKVDKATSELLVGPDWSLNMEICDFCNSNTWHTKDVMKEIKKRLHHKNSKIQLLTLTLLEAMVKNCGEYVHKNISDRKVLDEMIKIVKKKGDIHVRDKILILLSSWQEAFGGAGARYSQYYWACDELRRCGIQFPQHSSHSAPVITPPPSRGTQFGMASSLSTRFDEGTSSENGGLSESILESMRDVVEVLDDMVQVMNPNDRMGAKEEVIVELASRSRSNQNKLTQILTLTTDDDLVARGLEMNEWLESLLAMYDAIASGGPIPKLNKKFSLKIGEPKDKTCAQNGNGKSSLTPCALVAMDRGNQEEDHEDDFIQLVQRHSKASSERSQSATTWTTEDGASSSGSTCNALVVIDDPTADIDPDSNPNPSSALVACDSKEQEIIDLLSIVLTTNSNTKETTEAPDSASAQPTFEASFSTYVAPWAQSEAQKPVQSPNHNVQTPSYQGYSQYIPLPWDHITPSHTNYQPQVSNIYGYPYPTAPRPINPSPVPTQHGLWQSQTNSFQTPHYANNVTHSATQVRSSENPMHRTHSINSISEGKTSLNGNVLVNNGSSIIPAGHKMCVPPYKLFEDLNVLRGSEGTLKSELYANTSGNHNHNLFNGRR